MRKVLLHQIKSIMYSNLFPDIQCIFWYFKRVLTLYYKLIGHTQLTCHMGIRLISMILFMQVNLISYQWF